MHTLKERLAAAGAAAILLCTAAVPCLAGELPAEDIPAAASAPVSGGEEHPEPEDPEAAGGKTYLIPVESTQETSGGSLQIREVYEVPESLDPEDLVKEDFVKDGCLWRHDTIVREAVSSTSEQEAELEFVSPSDSGDLAQAISLLPAKMVYDQDGYRGDLYLDPSTVTLTATDTTVQSSTEMETQVYQLDYNDPSLLPQSYAGLPLTSWTFADGPYIEGSSLPQYYEATAVYSATSSWQVPCAWELKASYRGTAVRNEETGIRYTVTYRGEVIPEGAQIIDGFIVPEGYELVDGRVQKISPFAAILPWLPGIFTAALTLLVILLGLVLLYQIWRRGLLGPFWLTVYALDPDTGRKKAVQYLWVSRKRNTVTLRVGGLPSATHYLCALSSWRASQLSGTTIRFFEHQQMVASHLISPASDRKKYTFHVDLPRH